MASSVRPRPAKPPPQRRKRWRAVLGVGLLLLLLIWTAPPIVAHTPLRTWVARRLVSGLNGRLTLGGASLGWLSPVVLRDAEVRDSAGRLLLVVPRLESRKSLLDLLLGPSDLGTFRCERPALHVVWNGPKTNLEDVFARWLPSNGPAAPNDLAAGLEVVDARLTVHDDDTHQQWTLNPVSLSVTRSRDWPTSVLLKVQALLPDAGQTGRLEAELSVQPGIAHAGRLTARLDSLPLAVATPLLRRAGTAAQLDGRLSGRVECRWGEAQAGAPNVVLEGSLSGTGVAVAGPWLREDRLYLDRLEAPFCLTAQGSRLRVERAEVQCDLGKASLVGTVDTTKAGLAALAKSPGQIAADIDLARLVNSLPQTLHLRPGTRLSGGRLHVDLSSAAGADGPVWHGRLQTAGVTVVSQGRVILRPEAILLALDAHQAGDAFPVCDHFHGESSFLKLDASGAFDRLTATADYDLGRLVGELSHLVDLGPVRLQGQGSTRVVLQRSGDGRFTAQGEGQLRQFLLTGPDGRPWREELVALHVDVWGRNPDRVPGRFDAGRLRLEAGREVVEIQLLEPVQDLGHGPWGLWGLHAQGDLARWQGRLGSLAVLPSGWQLAGAGDLTARLRPAADLVKIEELKLALRELVCRGPELAWGEPVLDLEAAGSWQSAARKLELTDARLNSAALAVQVSQAQVVLPRRGPIELTGSAAVHGDLARLQQWVQPNPGQGREQMAGLVTGRVSWRHAGGRLSTRLDLDLLDVALGPPAAPTWREAQVQVRCQAACEPAAELLQIDQFRVVSSALDWTAQGRIARLGSSRDLLLTGQVRYDLEKLTPLLSPAPAAHFRVSGQEMRPFRIEGSLASLPLLASLSAEASLGWTSADLYGFQAGPAEIAVHLEGGWLRLGPVETTVNGGRVRLEPGLRLEPGPAELRLTPGSVIEQVRLTPATCAGLLGYAVPMLAGVTEVDGHLSLSLEGGQVPLTVPSAAQVGGTLTLHGVRVGSSPLLRELAVLFKEPPALTLTHDVAVPFRLMNGRVYHHDLELAFPEVSVRSSGSVGLDGTLDLVIEMPVPPHWLGHGKVAAALAHQTIRVPVRGTLQKPKLDEQALRQLNAQLVRESANDLLRQEADKQIKRLLRPRP